MEQHGVDVTLFSESQDLGEAGHGFQGHQVVGIILVIQAVDHGSQQLRPGLPRLQEEGKQVSSRKSTTASEHVLWSGETVCPGTGVLCLSCLGNQHLIMRRPRGTSSGDGQLDSCRIRDEAGTDGRLVHWQRGCCCCRHFSARAGELPPGIPSQMSSSGAWQKAAELN